MAQMKWSNSSEMCPRHSVLKDASRRKQKLEMNSETFRIKYLSLADTLYRVAFYILEQECEAKDAVQDLYLH